MTRRHRHFSERLFRRDAETSTRDACATLKQEVVGKLRTTAGYSLRFPAKGATGDLQFDIGR